MSFMPIEQLKVSLHFSPQQQVPVGRLAYYQRNLWFEYDPGIINLNLDISPFKLPLQAGPQTCNDKFQQGLFGVFYDSLPDGWGHLLLDRYLQREKIHPNTLTVLDKLAFVGINGMGALCYEPEHKAKIETSTIDLSKLAHASNKILKGETTKYIDQLLTLNGASSGVRPKILIGLADDHKSIISMQDTLPDGYSHWLLKFPALQDFTDISAIEYAYNLMAQAAGLKVSDFCLLTASDGNRYFATKRFDRQNNKRWHMHTLAALLHADFRIPSLDYKMLLKVTLLLTKDQRQVAMAFRLAAFNVFAHNRDDHGKNFSFLMDYQGAWQLAPAYDLTFSMGPGNEHSTTIMGEGKAPGLKQLRELALAYQIDAYEDILQQVQSVIADWNKYAQQAEVSNESIALITKYTTKYF